MAGQYMRLADAITLKASDSQDRDQVLDLGAYRQVVFTCTVLKPGSTTDVGKVKIQHAATNEANAWVDLTGVEWLVDDDATGGLASTDAFLRYVRWATDSAVDGDPVVTIDAVAKE